MNIDTIHKQVSVQVGAFKANVDEAIAPLIEELWKAGIMTLQSCQENKPGIIWIQFCTAGNARRFLNIVAQYEEGIDTLYNRARHGWCHENDDMRYPFWDYFIHPHDLALDDATRLFRPGE